MISEIQAVLEDRPVVTFLDAAGRLRPARLVIGQQEDRPHLEPLDHAQARAAVPIESGIVTGGFTDWHVHLHLIDWASLAGSPITRVHDLGGDPAALSRLASGAPGEAEREASGATECEIPSETVRDISGAPEREVPGTTEHGTLGKAECEGPGQAKRETSRTTEIAGSPLGGSARVSAHGPAPRPFELLHAGAFLTPPGGYPSDRSWAPTESYREVRDAIDAHAAVAEMVEACASAIKIASNSEAGPVFSDEVFSAIVQVARSAGLEVVAHAEGTGEALRAARLGATRLAHAPFTELLTRAELAELASTTSWCSTLDIHGWGEPTRELDIAVANVAGFVRQGGVLRYGTDMGNGPTPVGLNQRELDALTVAGLTPEQQLAALTPGDPLRPRAPLVWVPRDERGELEVAAAALIAPA